jgi:predicted CoA-binding protein
MRRIFEETRTAVIVGNFDPQNGGGARVLRFLQEAGYTVFPVGEGTETVHGKPVFRELGELPHAAELVVVTLPGASVTPWARRAVSAGAAALWLEKGIISPEAMQIAREGRLLFVMDHSVEEEYRRLRLSSQ